MSKLEPTIICIQETRFPEMHIPSFKNFDCVYKNKSNAANASGGVAIFIAPRSEFSEIVLNTTLYAVAIRIKYPLPLTICNVYNPPTSSSNHNNFNEANFLHIIRQLPKPYVIVGDFNAHNAIWGSSSNNAAGNIIENILINPNVDLVCLNNGSNTHFNISNGKESAIDLTLSSANIVPKINWNVTDDLCSSDHYPISIQFPESHTETSKRPRWILNNADWDTFSKLAICSMDDNNNNVENSVEKLTSTIFNAARNSIPLTSSRISKQHVPWWSPKVSEAIKLRKKALRKFKARPTTENLIEFKKLRANAIRTINTAKTESWMKFVSTIESQTPYSIAWDKVRAISGCKRGNKIQYLTITNQIVTDIAEIVKALGTYYQTISSSNNYPPAFRRHKVLKETNFVLHTENTDNEAYNCPFTAEELEFALTKCKGTSPGDDNITYEMIKNLCQDMKRYTLEIYNKIWSERVFPSSWRNALIVPIPKPGKPKDISSSYRPISLTSCVCKVLERMISKRLTWIIEKDNRLNRNQAASRNGFCTTDHLITLEDDIQEAYIHKKQLLAVFFDIKDAYPLVWRHNILSTLQSWGIKGNLLHFIESFMKDRTYQVIVGNIKSDIFVQENGICQGSVLSSILFLIGINSILDAVKSPIKGLLYADDLVLYVAGRDINHIENIMQDAIKKLQQWTKHNGLSFSPQKTAAVLFRRTRKPQRPVQLYMNNTVLPTVPNHKFLGITFDEKMNWTPHINELYRSCSKKLKLLKMLSHREWGAGRRSLLNVYKALILSKIDYGSIVYSSARQGVLKKLDPIHNTAIRICTGAYRSSPIDSLLVEAGVPSLENRRKRMTVNYSYKLAYKTHHPVKDTMYLDPSAQKYNRLKNPTKPFRLRCKELLNNLDITLPFVNNHQYNTLAPWEAVKFELVNHLSKLPKNTTLPVLYKAEYLKACEEFPDYIKIFTDGSKMLNKVACAFVTENVTLGFTLPSEFSIFSAELFAIYKALEYIVDSPKLNFLVMSDSLSSIQALSGSKPTKHYLLDKTKHKLSQICSAKNVKLMWVPGHSGIAGNEKADEIAKNTIYSTEEPIEIVTPLSDWKPYIRAKTNSLWELEWNQINNNKFRLIKSSATVLWHEFDGIRRKDRLVLARLRIGHTSITHSYLMSKDDPPWCQECDEQITVKHILESCKKYDLQRRNAALGSSLEIILNNDYENIKKLFGFLSETSLLNKI